MMDIRPIRNEANYTAALKRIEALMDAESGTAEGDELDVLSTLVEAYEQQHYVIAEPDPVAYIKSIMEFREVDQTELAKLLGSRSRASEILNRRRPLTLSQIRRISSAWNVSADPLIQEYRVADAR